MSNEGKRGVKMNKPILFRLSLSKRLPAGWEDTNDQMEIFIREIIEQGFSYTVSKDAVYIPLYY